MAAAFVVGLFGGYGVALDAYHRLHTEGFTHGQLAYHILAEGGPPLPPVGVERPVLQIEPALLDEARGSFAQIMRGGETAVFVRVEDDEAGEAASAILKLFAPLAVETLASGDGR